MTSTSACLKDGICSIDTGVVFLDVLNNAERISDHCSNIAVRMVGMEAGDDYDSHTLKKKHHAPTAPARLYAELRAVPQEYLVPLEEMEAWIYKCNEPLRRAAAHYIYSQILQQQVQLPGAVDHKPALDA